MIKIALELKEEAKDKIIANLKRLKYSYDNNSFNTLWVYDLCNVRFGDNVLFLENGSFTTVTVNLTELEYFEVHSQREA